mmetsp:Transcript_30650/g.76720  ORF Transcript_30650/g.76720 Transcript_30650/m.76720 type:complete len:217 (-) Transcript_30650:102-752(-)|eukprot:CAMPEP_0179849488 /NCGR_PEP_ID=MMETSP0982-20121206/7188_1 /TAXON_ID=483367 /ORGANISM="non described non described, Strain CCMP 2436" /LENGTH=216 /DNA_ID=CAMNT_0021734833 /DNA_START=904 /DNA_END=1554 /DNA_ORIENTATION=+
MAAPSASAVGSPSKHSAICVLRRRPCERKSAADAHRSPTSTRPALSIAGSKSHAHRRMGSTKRRGTQHAEGDTDGQSCTRSLAPRPKEQSDALWPVCLQKPHTSPEGAGAAGAGTAACASALRFLASRSRLSGLGSRRLASLPCSARPPAPPRGGVGGGAPMGAPDSTAASSAAIWPSRATVARCCASSTVPLVCRALISSMCRSFLRSALITLSA